MPDMEICGVTATSQCGVKVCILIKIKRPVIMKRRFNLQKNIAYFAFAISPPARTTGFRGQYNLPRDTGAPVHLLE